MSYEGVRSPGAGITDSCELPDVSAGNRSPGPLEEQHVLLSYLFSPGISTLSYFLIFDTMKVTFSIKDHKCFVFFRGGL